MRGDSITTRVRGQPSEARRMRVLVVLDTFPSLSEIFLYTTLGNLQTAGFEVVVYARRRGNAPHSLAALRDVRYLPSEQQPALIKAVILILLLLRFLLRSPLRAVTVLRDLRTQVSDTRALMRELYKIVPLLLVNADLTYFTFGGLAAKYLPYIKLTGTSVFSLRGSDINIEPLVNHDYGLKLQQAMADAAGVHCVCDAVLEKAEQHANKPLPSAQVIYTAINPVFLTAERTTTIAAPPVKIVSVGRIDWRKGYEHGLMAIAELSRRGIECRWEIIGSGPHETAIRWAVRDMELEDVVALSGGLNQPAVRERLLCSDIFFHPTVHEGLSNAVLEAMAVGLPVVTCDVGGMSEAVADENNGYLVEPRDWCAMADKLERLALDADLRMRMGQQARESVRDRFSLGRQQQAFAQFFIGTLGSP